MAAGPFRPADQHQVLGHVAHGAGHKGPAEGHDQLFEKFRLAQHLFFQGLADSPESLAGRIRRFLPGRLGLKQAILFHPAGQAVPHGGNLPGLPGQGVIQLLGILAQGLHGVRPGGLPGGRGLGRGRRFAGIGRLFLLFGGGGGRPETAAAAEHAIHQGFPVVDIAHGLSSCKAAKEPPNQLGFSKIVPQSPGGEREKIKNEKAAERSAAFSKKKEKG